MLGKSSRIFEDRCLTSERSGIAALRFESKTSGKRKDGEESRNQIAMGCEPSRCSSANSFRHLTACNVRCKRHANSKFEMRFPASCDLPHFKMDESLSITLWNVEWARPHTTRGQAVSARLTEGEPDIICVTEGYPELSLPNGHLVTSDSDFGYGTTDGRRKVLLWSKGPWTQVDCLGANTMPSGRFVAALTDTPLGAIRFVGVCIPWKGAHANTGRKDREPWEDHVAYLSGMAEWMTTVDWSIPTVLLGDFNQRIPRARQPELVYNRLLDVLQPRFKLATDGILAGADSRSIDHITLTSDLVRQHIETFSNLGDHGIRLSDHFGLRVIVRSISIDSAQKSHLA